MTARNYQEEPGAEWVGLQRWENEGGKFRQQHGDSLRATGEGWSRYVSFEKNEDTTGEGLWGRKQTFISRRQITSGSQS